MGKMQEKMKKMQEQMEKVHSTCGRCKTG
jgi:DNA-binding protein YbaB